MLNRLINHKLVFWSAITFSFLPTHAYAVPICFDVSKSEPSSLKGILTLQVFPGPPNYENVKLGDQPEKVFILKLAKAICITGDDNADPEKVFDTVHVVDSPKVRPAMYRLIGKPVRVSLKEQMSSHTGHHHSPLVAWVTAIDPN